MRGDVGLNVEDFSEISIIDSRPQVSACAMRPRRVFDRRKNRLLVHEILTLQLVITSSIGVLAIASLYWGGQWILQNNYSRWALQWTEELHELGAPLYLTFEDEISVRLEGYIEKYPEIHRVTYFELNGDELFSITNRPGEDNRPKLGLPKEMLAAAALLVGADEPYIIESSIMNVRAFDIYAPIWTESIFNDGLFDFDLEESSSSIERMSLIGYVGLELDFTEFHMQLLKNIKIATFVLLILLTISAIGGRLILRRALTAISDLQGPISELAKGNLAVQFKPAAHKEISDIVEALESTAKALGQRDAKLLKLANHDALTGLYNRRRFVDELQNTIDGINDWCRRNRPRPTRLDWLCGQNLSDVVDARIGVLPDADLVEKRVAQAVVTHGLHADARVVELASVRFPLVADCRERKGGRR